MIDSYHEIVMGTYMTDSHYKKMSDTRRFAVETMEGVKREFGKPKRIPYGEEAPKRRHGEPGRIDHTENFRIEGCGGFFIGAIFQRNNTNIPIKTPYRGLHDTGLE